MSKTRPNPEHFLERAQREAKQESRGRLKIYLGAAPGVGKTYKMLQDAIEKRAQGLDVVIGVAESHGRKEIDRLLRHFEILPRQIVNYGHNKCPEFNLDSALQRSPGLILVDEMAHSNIPGLRHSKRWQDIEELLNRGIDVYTTLNVQHIESLKDDVAQIIQAPIKETVPDSMIERAHTIELVDLPPEDLLKRLKEGKVYIPEQATFAGEHFFRKGNLIALRELALRVTAERVGTEVLLYREREGIKQIWPTREKILVCVGPEPEALKLIRGAKRLAHGLQADWLAVYIATPYLQSKPEKNNNGLQNLRLAELLGAETHVLTGFNIVKEIISFAREQNITQIIVWKNIRNRLQGWFRRNLVDELVRSSGEIDIYIMTGDSSKKLSQKSNFPNKTPWKIYGLSVAVVSFATLLNCLVYPFLGPSNLVMIYLLGVVVIALFGRVRPSIFASFLSVLAYDFFFITPFYSFAVSDIRYIFTLLVMLLVAQIISYLTIHIGRQAESAQLIQHQTSALYTFNRKLSKTRGRDKLLELGLNYISDVFDCDVMALLPKNNRLHVQASYPVKSFLNLKEKSIAQWVYDMNQAAGFGTDTLSSTNALYLPLKGSTKAIGVLRIKYRSQQLLTPERKGHLESSVNQMALALETDNLFEKARKNELEVEKDRARLNLLTSIFHDLSLPLKHVITALNSLKDSDPKSKLIEENIDHEINKLSRLNANLFQFIQFESEEVLLKKEPHSLKNIINHLIKTSAEILEKRPVYFSISDNVPLVNLDNKLIQEVLMNLLENAIKFSPNDTPIYINVELENKNIVVSIEDFGTGILPQEKNKLFKKFYRGKQSNNGHGLGLGLAICEKIIRAHGGSIWVDDIESKGASFRFTLPLST